MNFDVTYAGKVYRMPNGVVYTLRPDGNMAAAYADADRETQVTLTGYTAVSARGNLHYQTTTGGYIFRTDGRR